MQPSFHMVTLRPATAGLHPEAPVCGRDTGQIRGWRQSHPLYQGKPLFPYIPVDTGDNDTEDVPGQGANVHGDVLRNLFEQSVMVAVAMGKQDRPVPAESENLLEHLRVLRLGSLIHPREIRSEINESTAFSCADLGTAPANLTAAPVNDNVRHCLPLSFSGLINSLL